MHAGNPLSNKEGGSLHACMTSLSKKKEGGSRLNSDRELEVIWGKGGRS